MIQVIILLFFLFQNKRYLGVEEFKRCQLNNKVFEIIFLKKKRVVDIIIINIIIFEKVVDIILV